MSLSSNRDSRNNLPQNSGTPGEVVAMMERDSRYELTGLVEMDDAFFGPKGEKHGRGSERKRMVLCALSLYRDRNGEERPGFDHMRIVQDGSAETAEEFLESLGCGTATDEGRQFLNAIRTDGWRSYAKAAKAVIRGTYRGFSGKHLQRYLSEICYRFNRRFWEKELFDRLVQACISAQTITYGQLTR